MSIDLAARQRRANARYEMVRGLAYGLFIAVILTSLVLLLVQGREIRRQGDAQARSDKVQQGLSEQIVRQGDQLETLLDNREVDRAERAIEVAAAVKELTKVQQAQLVRHDADVSSRLQIILDELGKLQDPPRVVQLPPMTTRQSTTAPTPTAPRAVAPAPRPAPCAKAGNSTRCKK